MTTPVYSPWMRQLTDAELTELKIQREASLNQLETIAVKGVKEAGEG